MLDSERTFKIKVRLPGTVFEICLRQQLCAFKEFCMETRLSNIFKTTNVTNCTRSFNKTLAEVTSKWKTLKQPRLLFKGSLSLTYFWHSRWHYFGYISGKVAKTTLFRKPTEVSQSTSTFISIGLPITK